MDNYNYNYNYNYQPAPAPAAPSGAQAAFTPASIFFIVAGFFGLIANIIAADYSVFEDFSALAILASLGLIAIGVFLIIRKLAIGNLIAIGGTATFVLICFFTTFEGTLVAKLSDYEDDLAGLAALPVLVSLLFAASFALLAIFALATFLNNGALVGMKKVWFVPLISGIVAGVLEFIYSIVMIVAIDELSYYLSLEELTAKYVLEIFASIFLVVAIALLSKWYKAVLDEKAENLPVAAPVYAQPAAPQYQQPVQPVYQAPVQQPVAPQYQEPVQPVYAQPVAPVQQAPVEPVYAQPAAPAAPVSPIEEELKKYKDLFDRGIITEAEYNAKRAQLLNL